jgi:hypothetical protein
MTRLIAVAAAAAATLVLAPVSGNAQTVRGYYSATTATAPGKTNIITRSTVWKCNDTVCTAPKATSRDTIMCELVVREVGTLQSFSANGTAFDAEALEKCNARAR